MTRGLEYEPLASVSGTHQRLRTAQDVCALTTGFVTRLLHAGIIRLPMLEGSDVANSWYRLQWHHGEEIAPYFCSGPLFLGRFVLGDLVQIHDPVMHPRVVPSVKMPDHQGWIAWTTSISVTWQLQNHQGVFSEAEAWDDWISTSFFFVGEGLEISSTSTLSWMPVCPDFFSFLGGFCRLCKTFWGARIDKLCTWNPLMTSIFEETQPPKTKPFPIKTRVTCVQGRCSFKC